MEIQERVEVQDPPAEDLSEHFVSKLFRELLRRKTLILLLGILLLAIVLRFYHLGSVPGGAEEDETSAGYDAYALLTHGTDRWGNPFPIYLPSWGSGQNALLSYLNIPIIKLFGLNVLSVRLLPAIFGVLTVLLAFVFVRKIFDTRTGLLAAFLLCIAPWHIMISRWSLESNLLPFFLLLGVTTLVYTYESKHRKWLIPFSLVFLAVSFYAYATSAFVIPILILIYLFFNRQVVWQYKWSFLISVAVFLLLSFPFALFVLDNYILHQTPAFVKQLPFSVPLLISSRLEQVSTGNLLLNNLRFFASGFNDETIWKSISWYQPLGLLTMPLSCVGIYFNLKKRQKRQMIFFFWLISAAPIFFFFNLNSNRANSMTLPLMIFGAIGLIGLYDSLEIKQTRTAVFSILLAATTIYSTVFCYDYFRHYNGMLKSSPYYIGFSAALDSADQQASPDDLIYVSDRINVLHQADVLLFYLKADSQDFQQHSLVVQVNGHYAVRYYRNYRFTSDDPMLRQVPSFLAILRGSEEISCARTQTLYTGPGWTVERCFNAGG
ncbi:MAG TPA: glycosyltransferase family 39 protein [Ktedonobacteraceae bacterium]|nr:glycosyltransferase family 39 protein [Ktedonobacteraceae bacterium]